MKTAFWASMLGRAATTAGGAAAKAAPLRNTLGNLAGSAARGAFMVGPKAGATGTMKAVNGLVSAGTVAAPIATSALSMHQSQQQPGMTRTAAYAAGAEAALDKYASAGLMAALKHPEHLNHLLELGGLGVLAGAPLYHMAAPKQFQEEHPHVGEGLDLAGLGILGIPAIRGLMAHK